jgi:Putative Ig domain
VLSVLIGWLRRKKLAHRPGRNAPAPRRARPGLEVMEDRALASATLPAALNPPTTFTAVLGSPSPDKTTGTQTDRLFRDGLVPTCATPKMFPGVLPAGPLTFDDFAFTNTATTPTCVQVTYRALTGNGAGIFSVAYLGSFNPADVSQNWLSDAGFSPGGGAVTYSFDLPAGQTLHLVFNDTTAGGSFVGDTYRFTIANGFRFVPPVLPAARVGQPYQQRITTTGGDSPVTFRVSGGSLPPGLTFNPATGVISGLPRVAGTFRFKITATTSTGETITHEYTLLVAPALVRLLRRWNR